MRVRWLRQLACRAFWTAVDGRPGPVHLNFAFREPLVPDGPSGVPRSGRRRGPRRRAAVGDAAARVARRRLRAARRARPTRSRRGRGRWSSRAGRSAIRGSAPSLAAFCERGGFPLLADPLSGARRGPAAIAHYDALLRRRSWDLVAGPGAAGRRPPDLQAACAPGWRRSDALQVAFDPENAWQDPAGSVGTIVAADPRTTFDALTSRLPKRRKDTSWLDALARGRPARGGRDRLGAGLRSCPSRAWRPSSARCCPTTPCWSSPPRCRSATSRRSSRRGPRAFRVLSNRGANGIDGTVSTAFGVAAAVARAGRAADRRRGSGARHRRAAGRRRGSGLRLVIVLIDNDGGGIFHFLPAAARGRGVRRAHRHAPRPRLRPRRRAVRARLGARRRRRVVPRRAGRARWPPTAARSSASAPTATRTSSSTPASGSPSAPPHSVAPPWRTSRPPC